MDTTFAIYGCTSIGVLIELLFLAFLTIEFQKKSSVVQFPYFYILYIFYISDFLRVLTWIINVLFDGTYFIFHYFLLYYTIGQGVCVVLLSLNRAMAVALPVKYNQIWSGTMLRIILAFTVCAPLCGIMLSIGFYFLKCHSYFCQNGQHTVMLTTLISSCALVSASFVILFVGIRNSKLTKNKANAKRERRMMYHAVISSTLMIVCNVVKYVGLHSPIARLYGTTLTYCLAVVGSVEPSFPIVFLILLNEPFRCSLFKFVRVDKLMTRRIGSVLTVS